MIETDRLVMKKAAIEEINLIREIESDPENPWITLGSYEEHKFEIEDAAHMLLVFKDRKGAGDKVKGFALLYFDNDNDIFEIRRIAVTEKGAGLGEEAMRGIINYAYENTSANRLWLDVYTPNKKGIKLYEKLGMKREGILRANKKDERGYLDQIIYSLLRSEWENMAL